MAAYYDPNTDEIVIMPRRWKTSFLIVTILHELIHFILEHTVNRIRPDMLDAKFDAIDFRLSNPKSSSLQKGV